MTSSNGDHSVEHNLCGVKFLVQPGELESPTRYSLQFTSSSRLWRGRWESNPHQSSYDYPLRRRGRYGLMRSSMADCLFCGNTTRNKKYCSRSCAAKRNGALFPKRRKSFRKCAVSGCDSPTVSCKKSKCESHHQDYLNSLPVNTTIGEIRKRLVLRGKHPSWTHAQIRSIGRRWHKELLSLPCNLCGYAKHVELCHRIALSTFKDDTPLSTVNSRENVVQLCRNCHWELDNPPALSI